MRGEKEVCKRIKESDQALWALLRRGHNVSVEALFAARYSDPPFSGFSLRRKQQYVGKIISDINKQLGVFDHRIVPGKPRGTYVLRSIV